MHDVLAHRISLITMHAGALAYRTDLPPEQIRTTAELIQTKSHEALTDLRQVLGVLRDDPSALATAGVDEYVEPPQPTLTDLAALVAEAQQSGTRVALSSTVTAAEGLSDQVGRTAYRIVQEGLTNARKHAPGATVTVTVTGSPDDGLTVVVTNPEALGVAAAGTSTPAGRPGSVVPGAGLGLVGLRERAKLAGGTIETSGRGGGFELRGWLPWQT
jgi:signal transduction histidine kinase